MLSKLSSGLFICVFALVGCVDQGVIKSSAPASLLPAEKAPPLGVSEAIASEYRTAVELLKDGQRMAAQWAFESLLKRNDQIPGVHLNLALIQFQEGNLDGASEYAEQTLALSPRSARAHNLMGTLARRQGRFEEARLAYSRALLADPDYAVAHLNSAFLFDLYLREPGRARTHYLRYLELSEEPDGRVELWVRDLELRIMQTEG